jgi:hypothetical protein
MTVQNGGSLILFTSDVLTSQRLKVKNHQKFNCGCISKKHGHVIDKHVSFHLIHKNLTFNIKVKSQEVKVTKVKKSPNLP